MFHGSDVFEDLLQDIPGCPQDVHEFISRSGLELELLQENTALAVQKQLYADCKTCPAVKGHASNYSQKFVELLESRSKTCRRWQFAVVANAKQTAFRFQQAFAA